MPINPGEPHPPATSLAVNSRATRSWIWVLLPITLFVLLRLPILVHAPGGQDEHWFAIPGWTVWTEGIPRIPYVPTRERSTFFENADRCLMTLPPGLFYVQAPFHAFFSPGYATSRIPLFLGALASIAITYGVARKLGASVTAAVLAATFMAISRPLLFTGLMVRPDLLSAISGWCSLIALWNYLQTRSQTWLVASGLACGIAGLFHPFSIVFAMQCGAALVIQRTNILVKLKSLVIFGLACGSMISLWLPLIYAYPYEFRSQFFSNVLDRAGPGLPSRIIWPFPSLKHHAGLLYEFAGPWQCGLMVFGLVATTLWLIRRHHPQTLGIVSLLWSSVFLTAVVAGNHPTKGYWVYPALWIFALTAWAVEDWLKQTSLPLVRQRTLTVVSVGLAFVLMLPGAGLRSTWTYLTHWGHPRYHARNFIGSVLEELPEQGVFLADLSYVYDVYLSGRETRLCQNRTQYWGAEPFPYQGILLAWEGEDAGWAVDYDAKLVRRFGNRDSPQTCFVDWFQHSTNISNQEINP